MMYVEFRQGQGQVNNQGGVKGVAAPGRLRALCSTIPN